MNQQPAACAALAILRAVWRLFISLCLLAGSDARATAFPAGTGRDFAIDTYYPKPNELRLAEGRARRYWAKNAARYGPTPAYLAVETSKIFESEIVQDLWPKLINAETTSSFFAGAAGAHRARVDLKGVMIFDARTGHFVSGRGYVAVDTPRRGQVARFGTYLARYIGTGRGG
jgi:hypothetical protein